MIVHGKGNEGRVRPRRLLFNDLQHANISKSSCNVLDPTIALSVRVPAFITVDRRGLYDVLLSVHIEGHRYSAIAT